MIAFKTKNNMSDIKTVVLLMKWNIMSNKQWRVKRGEHNLGGSIRF